MAEKMYFGVPGNIKEIPVPKSGMGFDSNSDTEVTNLVSGGRSVYRAPTAYKSFNMTWATTSENLRHLIDLYNGQFGAGPFYITDPAVNQENVLPARWASSWQLAHQANGWCRPVIDTVAGTPVTPNTNVFLTNRFVTFKQVAVGPTVKLEKVVRTRLIRVPGKAYYLAVAGSATGGAGIKYRTFNSTTNTWSAGTLYTTFTGAPTQIVSVADTTSTMIELDLYMPLGSTLTLKGMALGTVNTRAGLWMPVGSGVGAVQFGDTTGGQLVSTVIDRIGLSLDFTEVQNVESQML